MTHFRSSVLARATVAGSFVLAMGLLSGCGSTVKAASSGDVAAAQARVLAIESAVTSWKGSATIEDAHDAAETVANLVTGPNVQGYGDRDRNGTVSGTASEGLLPGADGEASLGLPLEGCAGSALLGGSWSNPADRWKDLRSRVDQWTPTNNTFPALTSEAQRVVGWAQLTLKTSNLDDAREFAGHAQEHLTNTGEAIKKCL